MCVTEKMDMVRRTRRGRGFLLERGEKGGTDRAGGDIPEGTGSVLCDQDGDGFIRAATFSPCPLSVSPDTNSSVRVIYCTTGTRHIVSACDALIV